jgi:hypothetical protein
LAGAGLGLAKFGSKYVANSWWGTRVVHHSCEFVRGSDFGSVSCSHRKTPSSWFSEHRKTLLQRLQQRLLFVAAMDRSLKSFYNEINTFLKVNSYLLTYGY